MQKITLNVLGPSHSVSSYNSSEQRNVVRLLFYGIKAFERESSTFEISKSPKYVPFVLWTIFFNYCYDISGLYSRLRSFISGLFISSNRRIEYIFKSLNIKGFVWDRTIVEKANDSTLIAFGWERQVILKLHFNM